MKIIVCIGKNNSWLFDNKRVSSDKAVIEDIKAVTGQKSLAVEPYSADLFNGFDNLRTTINFDVAMGYHYCFIESITALKQIERMKKYVSEIIIYRFDKDYPKDICFQADSLTSASCKLKHMESTEFKGNSHEKITKEVYFYEEK